MRKPAGVAGAVVVPPVFCTIVNTWVPIEMAPALDVVFADGAPAARITELLRALGGEIAAGPTPLGRYRVRLPAGSDAAAAARRLRSEGAGVVLLAEPALP